MSDGGPGGWRKKRFGILVIACFFPVLPDYLFFFSVLYIFVVVTIYFVPLFLGYQF